MTARWSRRAVLKTLAASGGMLAVPAALRTVYGAEEPDVILRIVAAPAVLPTRAGRRTRGLLVVREPRERGSELRTQLVFRRMRGFLNGRSFDEDDMTAVAEDERLPAGGASVWTFENDGMGMAMPHPMHIHGVQFRVLERRGGMPVDLREGVLRAGYKDTVGIFAGERVRVLLRPRLAGLFMYHCHNLEHEDGGMMRNCRFTGS